MCLKRTSRLLRDAAFQLSLKTATACSASTQAPKNLRKICIKDTVASFLCLDASDLVTVINCLQPQKIRNVQFISRFHANFFKALLNLTHLNQRFHDCARYRCWSIIIIRSRKYTRFELSFDKYFHRVRTLEIDLFADL